MTAQSGHESGEPTVHGMMGKEDKTAMGHGTDLLKALAFSSGDIGEMSPLARVNLGNLFF